MALGMAIQLEHFTDENHEFLRATPAQDAGALIAQLCARAVPESRYETARQIVVDICSLARADIIHYFLCRSKRTDPYGALSDEECGELRDAFASRIAAEVKAGKAQIPQLEGGASPFHVWAEAAPDDVKEYLTLRFDGKPEEAVEFVALFCPTAYGPDGSHRSYFEAAHYRYLREIVDPEIVHQALIRHYGAEIYSGEYSAYARREIPTMRDLAGQFAYVHRHIEDM